MAPIPLHHSGLQRPCAQRLQRPCARWPTAPLRPGRRCSFGPRAAGRRTALEVEGDHCLEGSRKASAPSWRALPWRVRIRVTRKKRVVGEIFAETSTPSGRMIVIEVAEIACTVPRSMSTVTPAALPLPFTVNSAWILRRISRARARRRGPDSPQAPPRFVVPDTASDAVAVAPDTPEVPAEVPEETADDPPLLPHGATRASPAAIWSDAVVGALAAGVSRPDSGPATAKARRHNHRRQQSDNRAAAGV